MELAELCARNVSAALREALNALNCANLQHYKPGSTNVIPSEAVLALQQAVESLKGAAEALASHQSSKR